LPDDHRIQEFGRCLAIRRRDRAAAAESLDPDVVWQGLLPDLVCRTPDEVLDVFLSQRDREFEVDRLEVIGTDRGAVFAFHRPEAWDIEGVEVRGAIYHAVSIADARITRLEDHADLQDALPATGP
jgi:hypothetical protein